MEYKPYPARADIPKERKTINQLGFIFISYFAICGISGGINATNLRTSGIFSAVNHSRIPGFHTKVSLITFFSFMSLESSL